MDAISEHNGKPYIPPSPATIDGMREERKRIRTESRLIQERLHLESLKRQEMRAKESWGGSPWWGQAGSPQQSFSSDRPNQLGIADFAWFRLYGSNYPFWLTWVHHAQYRNAARILWTTNGNARGAVSTIASYVIGKELLFRAASKPKLKAPPPLIKAVQDRLDDFSDINDFAEMQEEVFVRDRRDGESFIREFPETDEPLQLRIVEPAEIMEPPDCKPLTDSYGIFNRLGDIYDRIGYYYAPDGNTQEGETVKASQMIHSRNFTDRHVKRGLTDFCFGTLETMRASQACIENMLDSGIEQSSIREIIVHEAASPQQVSAFRSAVTGQGPQGPLAVGGSNAPNGMASPGGANVFPGMRNRTKRLDIDSGQKYEIPPFTQNVEGYWSIVGGALRNVAVVWSAPEWIVNGDSSNNNYASSLTAESPFVKKCLKAQGRYERLFKRLILDALKHACKQGMVIALGKVWSYDEVMEWIEIQVEAPTVETRDLLKEAQRNQIRNQARVLSPQSWQLADNLDPDQEQANFEESDELNPPMGNPLGTEIDPVKKTRESKRLCPICGGRTQVSSDQTLRCACPPCEWSE